MREHPVVGERICFRSSPCSCSCFPSSGIITKSVTARSIRWPLSRHHIPVGRGAVLRSWDVYDAWPTARPVYKTGHVSR